MTNDPTKDTATDKDSALARQAKGSVQEAIGKIIGDTGVEQRGRRESKAGARQVEASQSEGDASASADPSASPKDAPKGRGSDKDRDAAD